MRFLDLAQRDARLTSDVPPVLKGLRTDLNEEQFRDVHAEGHPQGCASLRPTMARTVWRRRLAADGYDGEVIEVELVPSSASS